VNALLDTNAYVALRRGHPEVLDLVRSSSRILLSTVVVGELMDGFYGGSKLRENIRLLEQTARSADVDLLSVTWATAEIFGRISSALRRAGTPIPTNDVWIAAHATEHGGTVVTADAHFDKVPGLAVVSFTLSL